VDTKQGRDGSVSTLQGVLRGRWQRHDALQTGETEISIPFRSLRYDQTFGYAVTRQTGRHDPGARMRSPLPG